MLILQEVRYVIERVICDRNFEGLVLGCIEADFLQSNTRWKALGEIYQIAIPLHRSARKISADFRQTCRNFCKHLQGNSQFFTFLIRCSSQFSQIFMKFSRIFIDFLKKKMPNYPALPWNFAEKNGIFGRRKWKKSYSVIDIPNVL